MVLIGTGVGGSEMDKVRPEGRLRYSLIFLSADGLLVFLKKDGPTPSLSNTTLC